MQGESGKKDIDKRIDVVKISDEEVEFLFGLDARAGAAHILKEYGCKLVFVTCGAQGCFFANEQAEGFAPSLTDIKVVDTTGAGDIFGGSAVWKLLQLKKRRFQKFRFSTSLNERYI